MCVCVCVCLHVCVVLLFAFSINCVWLCVYLSGHLDDFASRIHMEVGNSTFFCCSSVSVCALVEKVITRSQLIFAGSRLLFLAGALKNTRGCACTMQWIMPGCKNCGKGWMTCGWILVTLILVMRG